MTRPVSVKAPAVALKPVAAPPLPIPLYYAQSSGSQQVNNTNQWKDIAGLLLILPKKTADAQVALVTLNVTAPYARGTNYPGCRFGIKVEPNPLAEPFADFTSYSKTADTTKDADHSPGRVPVTLVKKVALQSTEIAVRGAWIPIRGATCVIDTPCSLSAIIGLDG
jgi:hypothetical protein